MDEAAMKHNECHQNIIGKTNEFIEACSLSGNQANYQQPDSYSLCNKYNRFS